MDNIGFAILVPGKYMDIQKVAKLMHSPPTKVSSQIKINFSMVLNLLLSHVPKEVEELLDRSFANYQMLAQHHIKSFRKDKGRNSINLWKEFVKHLSFLQNENFVTQQGRLTEDGRWASQLRVDQPLLLAEGFRRDVFPKTDPALMAAIIAACINERDTSDPREKAQLPSPLVDAFQKAAKGLQPFMRRMVRGGFAVRPLALRPAAAVYLWTTTQSWEASSALAEMEEGLFASFILRTADNLRHIRHLGSIFPQASETAAAAIEKLLQDPVLIYY
jgi:superfamily II RNA helicase